MVPYTCSYVSRCSQASPRRAGVENAKSAMQILRFCLSVLIRDATKLSRDEQRNLPHLFCVTLNLLTSWQSVQLTQFCICID